MRSVIVGTAGHIDHGKTSLVKALTGIDADRLEEEKRRGITIDLGFAHMELRDAEGERLRIGFIDVPGHERFIRNMLAGIGGIDLALLVIAADEGIKPQTREHFDICRLLGISRGIVVLTKSDLVDAETFAVVRSEVQGFLQRSFLEGAPLLAVSTRTGDGVEQLKQELARVASEVSGRSTDSYLRLPIDRAFVMKGFGTVVTGTLLSGSVSKEDEVELFPAARRLRVRGVQVHGAPAERAKAGERTALNLPGIAQEELERGMVLAAPGVFRSGHRFDVELSLLPSAKPLRDRARVHLHLHAAEVIAEVALLGRPKLEPGESGFAQLRLAAPLLALPGDRFIIRQFSPVVTIGGGRVLSVAAPRSRRDAVETYTYLEVLARGVPQESLLARIRHAGEQGLSITDLIAHTGWRRKRIEELLAAAESSGEVVRLSETAFTSAAFDGLRKAARETVAAFHAAEPLAPGLNKEQLREQLGMQAEVFSELLHELTRSVSLESHGELVRLPGRQIAMKDDESAAREQIERAFADAGLRVPSLKEVLSGLSVEKARAQKIVTLLLREKSLVKLADDLVFHASALAQLREQLAAQKTKAPKIDVPTFKELTGISRKYAIPLLEYLDRERVTRRVGNERVIL